MSFRNCSITLLTIGLLLPAVMTAQPLGTVDNLGHKQQHFALKSDVHIQTAGLAPGDYYYQVTNPNGSVVLSTADISLRKVTVLTNGTLGLPPTPQLIPFDDTPNPGREYKVWLSSVADYDANHGFAHPNSHTHNFKVKETSAPPPEPEPPPTYTIGGMKYLDINTDGKKDATEVGVDGFRIVIYFPPGTDYATETTDNGGLWSLELPDGTAFRACETLPATGGWVQTGPLPGATLFDGVVGPDASRCWIGTVEGASITGLDFGNVCLGTGNGKSKGFWTNKNGQAVMNDGGTVAPELAMLSSLNLVSGTGAAFNPSTYDAFKNWLGSANATNMAYMLSAQLAAMELNVEANFVNGGCFLLAGVQPLGCTVPVNANQFISVNALMADADKELGVHPIASPGTLERKCEEFKKNILDDANNGKGYVQPKPCPVVYLTEN